MLKDKILDHIKNKDMENLKRLLGSAEEMEILFAFNDLSSDEQVIVFRLLTKAHALLLFEELDTDLQHNLLRSFTDEKAIEFVNELAPDDRVKLLDELPASVAKKLIAMLSPSERAITNILMGYTPETAGRIMTTEYISLRRNMTVEQAIKKVRKQAKDKETIYTLFVTDNFKKLEGVLSLKELLTADSDSEIESIMAKKAIKVSTDTDQEEVARTLQELDLLAIPVVDKEDRLVGIVTIDDAVDILDEEATEDIFDHAGLADVPGHENDRSDVLINGRYRNIWKVRLPFLLISLGGAMFSGAVIDGFERTMESITIAAIFIPLIMTMGGNVGMQSSTVFIRGEALGHIQLRNFLKHFLKEISVGFSIGVLIGIAAGTIAALWQGEPILGLVVGLSLTITMTFAALMGFLVPYALMKMNADQAAGSAPILTSVNDISGLVIYFVLVSTLMKHLM